jgi:hypothetical protein
MPRDRWQPPRERGDAPQPPKTTGLPEQAAWEKRRRAARVAALRGQREEDRLRREAEREMSDPAPDGRRRRAAPDQ